MNTEKMDDKEFLASKLQEVKKEVKLTNWKKEPSVADLKKDLDAAKPAHNTQTMKIKGWNDDLRVEGKAKPKKILGRSSVQPKLIRRQAEWRYSALTEPFNSSDKLFQVEPVTFEDTEGAKQNEMVLNYQFRNKLDRVAFIDDLVRATVDEGTAIVRLGWMRETKKVKEKVPVWSFYPIETEEDQQALEEALQLKEANPRGYDENTPEEIKAAVDFFIEEGTPCVAQASGMQVVEVEKIIENKPTVEVMNPQNVVIDPSCNGDLNKALFAVISFETHESELKKQGIYKNLDAVDWEGNVILNETEHESKTPQDFQFQDAARKKVVAYEYWGMYDVHGTGDLVPIVATWIGSVMIRLEENPYPDQKLPLVLVRYLPIKRELYGETDAELLSDNQKISGAIMRGIIDLLGRSANGQQGFAKGMLDPLNRRRYDQGQNYEFNPSAHPSNGVITHTYPEIPNSAISMLSLQNQEAEALTGTKSFSGGISGEAYGQVAAGIRGVLDASSKREMAILRRIAKGVRDIGNKIIAMNSVFLAEKEVVRITNMQFVTIYREDLKGNFDLVVDISTAEVDEAKSQDLGFMLQTIGPNMDPAINMKILSEIAELKRMPELAEELRNYQPQPDPMAEKMKELQLEEQELKNEELRSQIELNRARAKKEESIADLTDLDYVEQETGTKHARDMAKQKAQSQGNQNLEVTKALAKPRKEGETRPNVEAAIGFNEVSNSKDEPQSPVGQDDLSPPYRPSVFDATTPVDPRRNIGSRFFDPSMDPALNPNLSI